MAGGCAGWNFDQKLVRTEANRLRVSNAGMFALMNIWQLGGASWLRLLSGGGECDLAHFRTDFYGIILTHAQVRKRLRAAR